MAARDLLGRLGDRSHGRLHASSKAGDLYAAPEAAPLGGTRAEAIQRLQVGLTGLCSMILVIGVASILGGQADIAEEAAVPDAAPTTEPTAAPPQRDPLADAGVVPDIPPPPEVEQTEEPGQSIFAQPDGALRVPDTPPTEPQETENPR